jgi:ATP-dependent helicase/nuclease subunit A
MTRARDYLVVMLRHSQPGLAEEIWRRSSELRSRPHASPTEDRLALPAHGSDWSDEEPALLEASPVESDLVAWRARRAELLSNVNRRRSVAPSSLGHQLPLVGEAIESHPRRAAAPTQSDLDSEDDEASPWRRARQASARGRAVHAVLQRANLRDSTDLGALAVIAASDEGIQEQATTVERLARAALDAPTVQGALLSRQMMRELPLRVGIGEGAIEGIVDLCYLEEDGLVLVDYKTDALGSAADLASAGARYHLQIGAYALALERGTGLAVRRAVLIFLAGEGGALEYEVPDLPSAVAAARLAVAEVFRAPLVSPS